MPNQEKFAAVARIKDDLSAADAVWIVDYRGLSVKQSEELRAQIRKVGAQIKIYKNSLMERALTELELPELGAVLEGPSAFVFVSGDPVESAKAVKVFAKANEALQIKGGMLDKQPVSAQAVLAIADLPSREELLAKLLGTISNPLVGVVRVLNAVPEKFVRTLQAVADKAA
ncbi:MAG: 50S ribosomal protein L10 [Coriobacteriales bacterium]|jgi:large subunit ribosomal protein L10|nr:50S ribosomal protein L10 [Coriobacteriales bacterium]